MSDTELPLDTGSVDTGASEGISLREGAEQLVSEREVTPSETRPEIVDYLHERGRHRDERESVSAREAADALTQLREGRLKELRGFEQVADRGQVDDMRSGQPHEPQALRD